MDPSKIEAADREFVRKLHQLRSQLAGRQKRYENRSWLQFWHRPTVWLFSLLIIAGVGTAAYFNRQAASPIAEIQQAAPVDPVQSVPSVQSKPVDPSRPESDGLLIETERLAIQYVIREPIAPLDPSPPVAQANAAVENESKPQPAPATAAVPQNTDHGDIELMSALVCQGVRQRQPLKEKVLFDLAEKSRAYVWMDVRSANLPFVIKHVYYVNGYKYCEVPLDIRYPRMRTWSYVTLKDPDQKGSWTVEVVYDHRVLKTVAFQVSGE